MMRRTWSFSPAGWPAMGERGGLVEVDQGGASHGRERWPLVCVHTYENPAEIPSSDFFLDDLSPFVSMGCRSQFVVKKHLLFRGKLSTGRGLPVLLSVINGPSLSPSHPHHLLAHIVISALFHTQETQKWLGWVMGMEWGKAFMKKLIKTYINDQLSSILWLVKAPLNHH